MKDSRCHSSGNVLFLILLAVALFAALSYAVSQTGRTGGATSSADKDKILAAQVLQYMSSVAQAVTKVRIVNRCTDTQINFVNSIISGYSNSSAPANKSCNIFDPAGGGIIYQTPPPALKAYDYLINGETWVKWVGTGDSPPATSANAELGLILPITSLSLCLEVNKSLSLPAALAFDYARTTKFVGTYAAGNYMPDDGGNVTGFYGARAACYQSNTNAYPATAGANYFIYYVLLAR